MKAYNKSRKPKHFTKPKWHTEIILKKEVTDFEIKKQLRSRYSKTESLFGGFSGFYTFGRYVGYKLS